MTKPSGPLVVHHATGVAARDSGAPVTVIKSAPAQYDTSTVSTEQHFATSADGTEIPYFVIRDEM